MRPTGTTPPAPRTNSTLSSSRPADEPSLLTPRQKPGTRRRTAQQDSSARTPKKASPVSPDAPQGPLKPAQSEPVGASTMPSPCHISNPRTRQENGPGRPAGRCRRGRACGGRILASWSPSRAVAAGRPREGGSGPEPGARRALRRRLCRPSPKALGTAPRPSRHGA